MTSMVLQRLQAPGTQTAIAAAMCVSESTVSRAKTEHLETLCQILAHAGLKIVPTEAKCFPADKVEALLTLARSHLASMETHESLVWE